MTSNRTILITEVTGKQGGAVAKLPDWARRRVHPNGRENEKPEGD